MATEHGSADKTRKAEIVKEVQTKIDAVNRMIKAQTTAVGKLEKQNTDARKKLSGGA